MEPRTRNVTSHPFVQALCKFEHSPKTNMAKRQVNNKDFIALCIFALGPLSGPELRLLAGCWRGPTWGHCAQAPSINDRVLDSYFIPHYGYTATDVTGAKRYGGPHSSAKHVKFWWRCQEHQNRDWNGRGRSAPVIPMQVFRNDLTQQGLARVRQLLMCPEAPLKELLPAPPRDAAQETLEAVVGAVVDTLERESDAELNALMNRSSDLREAGGTDFSKCDVDAIMRDPSILAALKKSVEGAIGTFRQFGDPE